MVIRGGCAEPDVLGGRADGVIRVRVPGVVVRDGFPETVVRGAFGCGMGQGSPRGPAEVQHPFGAH
ncbi:hypothetical protein DDQ41_08335 [Streptomyces spongiicola]|uniref:Uncharacterized protein n=1 Tax=Streptomyces spongiicola TaxID=1690221 RepID=A0ABM6V4A2_9ACTN|nr:hypothetical protein DDQ41_08335 [Streptomyces spongiicola]